MSKARLRIRREGAQAGFTVLEILVAVTVLALLMIGLTQGARSGFAFWAAQARRSGETAELDATARVLRNLLAGIPISAPTAPGRGAAASAIAFEGHPDRLAFIGDLPTGFGDSRRADITISLRGGRLMLAWTPHRHETSGGAAPVQTEVELIRGVEGVAFAYWGDATGASSAQWLSQWDGPALPQLIRVRLGFGKGDGRHWPDLVAAPQLWASGG
jgi:general secretion pathway protein J